MDWFAEVVFDIECSLKCFAELVFIISSSSGWSETRFCGIGRPAETAPIKLLLRFAANENPGCHRKVTCLKPAQHTNVTDPTQAARLCGGSLASWWGTGTWQMS